MSDYIKRKDALRAFNGSCSTVDADDILRHLHKSIDVIKNIPSADVVEVVRCKDCRLYNTDNCYMIHGQRMNRDLFEDDFCSYGERGDK